MRFEKTVEQRDQRTFLSNIVHDEWLEQVIAGHNEDYKDWANFAAWLIVKCTMPEQRDERVA